MTCVRAREFLHGSIVRSIRLVMSFDFTVRRTPQVLLLAILALVAVVGDTTTASLEDNLPFYNDEAVESPEYVEWDYVDVESTTQNDLPITQLNSSKNYTNELDSIKRDESYETNLSESKNGKPFSLGKKFESQKGQKPSIKKDDLLVLPLIVGPIRTLPNTLKNDSQNKSLNVTLKSQKDTSRNKNDNNSIEEKNQVAAESQLSNSKNKNSVSRQNYDRSLAVVLPFKAADNDNIKELYTKKPFVKMFGSSAEFKKEMEKNNATESSGTISATTKSSNAFIEKKTQILSSRSSTETVPQITKKYTTYTDTEQVTKKYNNPASGSLRVVNHKYDSEFNLYKTTNEFKHKEVKPKKEEDYETNFSLDDTDFIDIENDKQNLNISEKDVNQTKKKTNESSLKSNEFNKILEILPSDMKKVIFELDLNKNNQGEKQIAPKKNNNEEKKKFHPVIDAKSYAVFKPLPMEIKKDQNESLSKDMKTFLASFGLLPYEARTQKSLKKEKPTSTSEISEANINFLPDDLKSVLSDMGLLKLKDKKDETTIHVFNPSNHSAAQSDEDLKKLNAILSSIKTTVSKSKSLTPEIQTEITDKIKELNNLQYKSKNISEINNEIQKIVRNKMPELSKPRIARRITKLFDGPDPLILSEENILKNDFKRQTNTTDSVAESNDNQPNTTSTSSTRSSDSQSEGSSLLDGSDSSNQTLTDATEENSNLEALKDSFGGGETASDSADVESSLPPKKPNGLYFLFDWNSFLEVGTEDDKRRVNLRFQPKIGDSRNFLPVSVP